MCSSTIQKLALRYFCYLNFLILNMKLKFKVYEYLKKISYQDYIDKIQSSINILFFRDIRNPKFNIYFKRISVLNSSKFGVCGHGRHSLPQYSYVFDFQCNEIQSMMFVYYYFDYHSELRLIYAHIHSCFIYLLLFSSRNKRSITRKQSLELCVSL